MNAITFDPHQNRFKDTLFESVSHQPWSLEYKMVFTETRLMLNDILTELQAWHTATHRLFEAEAESTAQVLARFEKLGHLSPDHMDKLAAHVSRPKDAPPPGLLNKVLNTLKKGLDRLSKVTTYPPVDDAIQATISRIRTKSEDSPWKELLKKPLRLMLTIAEKGGWVASLVLLALGIVQFFMGLPIIGSSIFVLAIVAAVMRVVADLVNGKSITYALGKAATLYGAGYGAAKLFELVMPLLSSAVNATPPTTLGGTPMPGAGADEFTAGLSNVPMPGAGADEFTAGLSNVPMPGAGADQFTQGGTAALLSTGNAYIDGLQRLYGAPIRQFSGSFDQAFAAAKNELGAGKIFSWLDPSTGQLTVKTTNTAAQGIHSGLSNAVVNYLTKTR